MGSTSVSSLVMNISVVNISVTVGRHKSSESTPHEEVAVCGFSACIKPIEHSLELLNEYLQKFCPLCPRHDFGLGDVTL